ncbi:MAG: oligosaccharide repeat unit polymerase [Clostridiales bacterium]|nr:oligosaccharide repeat unit polymerase [Clostridiales bacterium]
MIYILFIALLVLTGVAFVAGNRNILSPWTIVCAMFTLSAFFAMINVNKWGYTIDAATVLIILSALAVFGVAHQLILHFMEKRRAVIYRGRTFCPMSKCRTAVLHTPIQLPITQMLLVCGVLFVMLLFYFYKTYQLSLTAGNPGGLSSMLKYVREAVLNFGTIGKLGNIFAVIAQAAGYVFSFIFLYNLIWCGWKWQDILLAVPLVILMAFRVLSAARDGFIIDIAYLLIVGCVLYQQKKRWNYWNTVKIILLGAAALCLFLVIFRLTGLMKDSGTGTSMFSSISKYIGFSIPGFNDYVLNPRADTGYFGDHTLLSVYSVLRQLGLDLPQLSIHHDFVAFPGIESNVYSCLRRYIEDYGYLGMYVIMAGLGALYSALFHTVQSRPDSNFLLIVYANLSYSLFMCAIDDQFLLYVFSTTFLYLMIFIGAFYYFFVYRCLHPKAPVAQGSFVCQMRREAGGKG